MATANGSATNTNTIPLSDIHVDYTWNSRSNLTAQIEQYRTERDKSGRQAALASADGTPDELSEGKSKGFRGVMASVRMRGIAAGKPIHEGQLTPVVVRLKRKDEKFRQPYVLVAGFTRFAVVQEIAAEEGEKKPVIKCFPPRPMNEDEALEVNGLENMVRDDLTAPDKCMIIVRMKRENPSLTQTGIALALGLHQTYVGKCLTIASQVKGQVQTGKGTYMPILDHWRRGSLQISVNDMLRIASLKAKDSPKDSFQPDIDAQAKLYDDLLRGKKDGKKDKRDPKAKVASAKQAAERFASMVGHAEFAKVLHVDDPDKFFANHLHHFVTIPKVATESQKQSIASAATAAYVKGCEGPAEPVAETVPADRPSSAGKGKGKGKGKGNASANAN